MSASPVGSRKYISTLPVRPLGAGPSVSLWRGLPADALRDGVVYRGGFFPAGSVRTGRNVRLLVTAALADWGLLGLADDVRLCATELASNAARHARPVVGVPVGREVSVGVLRWRTGELFLEVGDYDPRMPVMPGQPGAGADPAVAGRGLLIVAALADRVWWRRAAHGGKVVYARFGPSGRGRRERVLTG